MIGSRLLLVAPLLLAAPVLAFPKVVARSPQEDVDLGCIPVTVTVTRTVYDASPSASPFPSQGGGVGSTGSQQSPPPSGGLSDQGTSGTGPTQGNATATPPSLFSNALYFTNWYGLSLSSIFCGTY